MRTVPGVLLVSAILLASYALASDEDAKAKQEAQKKKAEANWEELDIGPAARLETGRFLIYAPETMGKQLKNVAASLDRSYDLAAKALKMDPKESPWAGKLAVYLLAERDQFASFVRRIEKRRLQAGESGSSEVLSDTPHVVAGPGKARTDPSAEAQAAGQVGVALLRKKAGKDTPLPYWLLEGFGRATYARSAPADLRVRDERKRAADLVVKQKRTAADAWGGDLSEADTAALSSSLADFMAYGPGASKFVAIVEGFKPGENEESRTTGQALESAGIKMDAIDKAWQGWVPRAR